MKKVWRYKTNIYIYKNVQKWYSKYRWKFNIIWENESVSKDLETGLRCTFFVFYESGDGPLTHLKEGY